MNIQIANTSKETLQGLLTNAFHEIDFEMDHIYNESERFIETAKDCGWNELAEEFENLKPR